MKKLNKKVKNFIFLVLTSLVMSSLLTACSEDKPEIKFDHSHSNIGSLKKHTFEHKFADQCVARELKNSVNKKEDKKRFQKSCLCIATRIMRNLTEVEAEKFLVEKKNTQSLKMSFDEAAYFCLQKTAKAPILFNRK
ncbi:MAG: hypothetical protein HFP81_10865 [Methylococcales symbiont of Hymedesmia sp. n. MRB-2018]|nr:MAG: hypothetical protein HFP78_10000 [Methylococcales symbiont of Hymedesmia sp. n. MRB-2018]KAF3982826.1 MAG: hypothetical protein HFP81_10865 [Methylococcales symbiont of Hymedesmia sp. n. MRB-2018]